MTLLLCDFDRPTLPQEFAKRLRFVVLAHQLHVRTVRYDRTEHGWHVVIDCSNRIAFVRQILLQSLLGSDWRRETFNSRRAIRWRHVPAFWRARANVLYQRHYREVTL